jgi:hypothetical protein
MGRLAENARKQNGNSKRPQYRANAPVPDWQRLYRDMAALFRRDLANVEAGLYPLPRDRDGSLLTLLLFSCDGGRSPWCGFQIPGPHYLRSRKGDLPKHLFLALVVLFSVIVIIAILWFGTAT